MKHFFSTATCFCFAIFFCGLATVRSQTYFYENFNNVSMDANGVGDVPAHFTLYNDQNAPYTAGPDFSYFKHAWQVMHSMDGQGHAASLSFFKESKPANRWMITPAITLPAGSNATLFFRAKAGDNISKDGFKVLLSTTTNDSTAFTVELRSVREAKGEWTDYNLNLSEYSGKTIYIAFIENSLDKYTILMDDIRVSEEGKQTIACNNAHVPTYMLFSGKKDKSYPIKASLLNLGTSTINSFNFCYKVGNEDVISTPFSAQDIQAGKQKELIVNYTPTWSAGNQEFKVWFENINGQNTKSDVNTVSTYIVGDSAVPSKTVFLELFSSAMCVGCGPVNEILHHIFGEFKVNDPKVESGLVAAKYQVDIPLPGDRMVTSETAKRSLFYGVYSAPSGYMNGFSLNLFGGEEALRARILDSLTKFRNIASPLHLSINVAREDNTFKINTKVSGILPYIGNYKMYINLIADSIYQMQAQISEENNFFNVVRKMVPDDNGTALLPLEIGESVTKEFEFTFDGENPVVYADLSRIAAVVFIQDINTKEVIQAAFSFPSSSWTENESGKPKAVESAYIYPNPAQNEAIISFQALLNENLDISIIDVRGRLLKSYNIPVQMGVNRVGLPLNDLLSGMYIIRIEGAKGSSSLKLFKK